jgi:G patch domain-containing protein 1
MDEEDLAAAAESRQLETAQSYAAVGSSGDNSSGNDGFFGLFMKDEDTIGVKILQKMGWRRDQGVGRKIRRSARADEVDQGDLEDPSTQHSFAPQDVQSMPVTRHEHRKGLGFQSEARLSTNEEDSETKAGPTFHFLDKPANPRIQKQPVLKKSSFGVGVLNDTGSDDEDPYELGPKITFNKTIGKDKKAKKPSKFAKPGGGEKVVYIPKKNASKASSAMVLTSRDGHLPLRGFMFATVMVQPSKHRFPPPKIPQDWKSAKGAASATSAHGFQSVADAAKSSTLDAKARTSLLGETPLPGKSVFDFMSPESRDRLVALTGKTTLPQALGQAIPGEQKEEGQKSLWSFVPNLDKDIAAGALAKGATGWMPYGDDPQKRARYIAFLELRSGTRQELPVRASGMTVSDWAKELQEFAHAAQVFKPTSGIMASRFTSASSSAQSTSGNGTGNDLLRAPVAKAEDPAEQAAKLGMYGPMTRSEFPFHPTRLLCKRFNVAPPAHVPYAAESGTDNFGSGTQEPVSKPALDRLRDEFFARGSTTQRPAWMNQHPTDVPMADPAPVTEHAIVDVENNEALAKERAPEDVFKSIFGDDDDD